MNVVYWLTFEHRKNAGIEPYYYIGSKHNCSFVDGVILDSSGKEYWSSCEQSRFIDAIKLETPSVKVLEVDGDPIEIERRFQIEVGARDNTKYFNLVYAGGGFGMSGENHPAKNPKVRANMKASNYMNQDDFRPWKSSRANKEHWKQSHSMHSAWKSLFDSNSKYSPGWRRCKGLCDINITDCTAKTMVKWFNSGWIPMDDAEYIRLLNE